MAVAIALAPDLYALTKGGRMLYRFTGSGRYQTTGVKAENRLLVTGVVHDGDQIVIRWNGQTYTLTARTNPSLPTEFPAGNGSSAYVDTLLAYFKSYFPFRTDFIIDQGSIIYRFIRFTARQAGKAFEMSFVQQVGLGGLQTVMGSFALALETSGADPILRERYGVYLEVYLQRAGTAGTDPADFDLIDTPFVECDADGVADYDLGDTLHSYLSADIPDFSAQGGQLAVNSHRAYYISYGEAWGQPITVGLIGDDSIRHAYLGGADFRHRSGGGLLLTSVVKASTADADRALRFGPTAKAIRIDQPEFLTFVNLRAAGQVKLKVVLTFDNNSTADRTGIQAVIDYQPGAKVCFPVGIGILDLLSQVPQGRFLKEYSVRLVNTAGDYLSRTYRYIVEYDLPEYRRYFQFLGSLGQFSGLMTYGKGSRELARFYEQADRYLLAGYLPTDAQFIDYNLSLQQRFEVASGWQDQDELTRWDEFYCSPLRLQIIGDKCYAIGLTAKTIEQETDGDRQFAHKLELAYLHLDEFYTDVDTPDGDEMIPPIALPAGTVVVSPQVVTPVTDPTIPAFVRELTQQDINGFKLAAARPNPESLGYINQTTGNQLYRQKTQLIDWMADVGGKPTTRDQLGIAELATQSDIIDTLFKSGSVRVRLKSWTTPEEPQ